jgi:hypothetical protein
MMLGLVAVLELAVCVGVGVGVGCTTPQVGTSPAIIGAESATTKRIAKASRFIQ